MIIKQLSVFIENKKGHLAILTDELNKKNIDIRAIAVFDTSEFGILRMIVDDPDLALATLKEAGFIAKISEVLAIEPEDKPGSLNLIFNILDKNEINIEYIYSCVIKYREMPLIIFKVDDQERAIQILQDKGITVASKKEVYGK